MTNAQVPFRAVRLTAASSRQPKARIASYGPKDNFGEYRAVRFETLTFAHFFGNHRRLTLGMFGPVRQHRSFAASSDPVGVFKR
jgi:hypothetical protein